MMKRLSSLCMLIASIAICVYAYHGYTDFNAQIDRYNDLIAEQSKEIYSLNYKLYEAEMALKHEKEKANTPQEMIEESCKKHGVDPELAVAVARLETGHFTSYAFTVLNNVGGMSINEEPIAYGSLEEGVDAFVKNLAHNYIGQGLTTPEEIGEKYCPVNSEWASKVKEIMEDYRVIL